MGRVGVGGKEEEGERGKGGPTVTNIDTLHTHK